MELGVLVLLDGFEAKLLTAWEAAQVPAGDQEREEGVIALSVSISWVDALMVERARATQAGTSGSGRRVIQGYTHPLQGSWSRGRWREDARAQALL